MFCELTKCCEIILAHKIVLELSYDRLWIGPLIIIIIITVIIILLLTLLMLLLLIFNILLFDSSLIVVIIFKWNYHLKLEFGRILVWFFHSVNIGLY